MNCVYKFPYVGIPLLVKITRLREKNSRKTGLTDGAEIRYKGYKR
jgi:hypothetical protein